MMNIRYRTTTNAWPGFVDLFSNLVIILIFLLIVFVFLWTTTSVFNTISFEDVNGTIEYAISEDFREDLLFQPKREVKVIPMKWFKAAETHIRSGFSSTPASSLVVKHRAYDAYRVYHMRNL